jgi:hypothetical protein
MRLDDLTEFDHNDDAPRLARDVLNIDIVDRYNCAVSREKRERERM